MAIKDLNVSHRATPGHDFRHDAPLDVALQADPEMAEGPAATGRITVYAIAVLVTLGAVFYGLNRPQPTAATNPPATTTGAAPAQPTAPQSGPTGTEIDRSKG